MPGNNQIATWVSKSRCPGPTRSRLGFPGHGARDQPESRLGCSRSRCPGPTRITTWVFPVTVPGTNPNRDLGVPGHGARDQPESQLGFLGHRAQDHWGSRVSLNQPDRDGLEFYLCQGISRPRCPVTRTTHLAHCTLHLALCTWHLARHARRYIYTCFTKSLVSRTDTKFFQDA
jgi:hypothetical protein